MAYSRDTFVNAYKSFALEWAEKFLVDAFEEAKVYPDMKYYSKKIYAHKKIVDEIMERIQDMVDLHTITVSMSSTGKSQDDLCATFNIEWR